MAISAFIPEVWSARFLSHLDKLLVYGSVFNRSHESELRDGDTVHVPVFSKSFTVGDYTRNTNIDAPEQADGSTVDVVIDKQKYFNFSVDDVDAMQSRPSLMDEAMGRAAYDMALQMDEDFKAGLDGIPAANIHTVSDKTDAATFVDKLIGAFTLMKAKMTNAGHPEGGRWAIISAHTQYALDERFISKGIANIYTPATSDAAIRNGFVGRLLGFDLRLSTNERTWTDQTPDPDVDYTEIVLGQGTENLVGVVQMNNVEAYRIERQFGDGVKGLAVYGLKNIAPDRTYAIRHQEYDI